MLVSLLLVFVAAVGCKPRVLVVGLDGASWKILDPLMDGGYVPTIDFLVSNGVKADLDCEPALPSASCFCPPVWQSIVTGQPALVHGVFNFPTLSYDRKSPTLWDLNREYGGRSTILSLHNIWPPDPTADVVLTEEGSEIFGGILFQMSPMRFVRGVNQPTTWTRPVDLFDQLGLNEEPQGGHAWFSMAKDRVSMEMLDRLALRKRDERWVTRTPEFDMVLLHSTDRSMHMTWPSIQPQPGDPIDVAALHGIADQWSGPVSVPPPFQWGTVASQFIEMDRRLGELLDTITYDYVVLLSDHGMASGQGPFPGNHQSPDAFSGIFAIYGPGVIRSGVSLPEISVLDVAPTLAYLLGIPIADDLPGRFVAEAIDPSALLVAPPKRIDSWDPFLPFP